MEATSKLTEWITALVGFSAAVITGVVIWVNGYFDARRTELETKKSELSIQNTKLAMDNARLELDQRCLNIEKTSTEKQIAVLQTQLRRQEGLTRTTHATDSVQRLLTAKIDKVPDIIRAIDDCRDLADELLMAEYAKAEDGSPQKLPFASHCCRKTEITLDTYTGIYLMLIHTIFLCCATRWHLMQRTSSTARMTSWTACGP